MNFKIIFALFCSVLFFSSCRHDADFSGAPEISFKYEVQSIIIGNCTESGCHASGSDSPGSLVTFEEIQKRVSPGDPRNSQLYERVVGKSGSIMPPSSRTPLTNDQIRSIYIWIEQGAKNN